MKYLLQFHRNLNRLIMGNEGLLWGDGVTNKITYKKYLSNVLSKTNFLISTRSSSYDSN